jgi:hypothetical protein
MYWSSWECIEAAGNVLKHKDSVLVTLGFDKCSVEHAVYKKGANDSLLVVGVYVDDLIICGPSVRRIIEFKGQMTHTFNMSDLGMLSYYME